MLCEAGPGVECGGGGAVRVAHADPGLSSDMKTLKEFGKKYARK